MSVLGHLDLRQAGDLGLMVLLLATLAYAFRLERCLGRLRGERIGFETMLRDFAERAGQAEDALRHFSAASDGIGRELAARVATASALHSDLGSLTGEAARLLRELQASIASPRSDQQPVTMPSRPERPARTIPAYEDGLDDAPRSRAERDLLHALKAMR